jgi:DNA-binding response OmpR family regulator
MGRRRDCPVPAPAAKSSARLKRILLIDDTPEIAELLSYALRDNGFEVFTSGFTDSVNELVTEQRADALVLDCSVYNMSETLFDTVRYDPAHAELPVVIISDTPEEADKSLRARDAKNVMLIPKPFTGSHVARALAELLGQRAERE